MKRILVVDDERDQADLLAGVLRDRGYNVDAVYDGLKALERLRETKYDAVVSDLLMPGATGYDVVEQARHLGVRTHIVTASSEEDVRKAESVATRVLRKPYKMRDIADSIIDLVGYPNDANPEIGWNEL